MMKDISTNVQKALGTAPVILDLKIKPVLIFRAEGLDEARSALMQLEQLLPEHVFLLALSPDVKIESLSEEEMNAAGWYRHPPQATP